MSRRIPVEPLSEARRGRIERALFERVEREPVVEALTSPDRRASAWPVVAVVASVVLVVGGWWVARSRQPVVSRLETSTAPAHVTLGESSLDIAPNTSLSFVGDDSRGVEVDLDRGAVECEVAPRAGRPPFVVRSGAVLVRVVGTHFRVERVGDSAEAVRVSVSRGVVEVDSAGSSARVAAGEQWPPAPTPSAHPAPELASAAPPAVDYGGRLLISPRPSAARVDASVVPPSTPSLTSRERYEAAIALESTDPEAALQRYRELATGSDSWAMNALFASARFESERGHREQARGLASEYIERFPHGPNVGDSRALLER